MSRFGYCPHTPEEIREMLAVIGVEQSSDLFAGIPRELLARSFNLPDGMSEFDMLLLLGDLAARDRQDIIPFIGGGYYDHFIP
jgi:glycine dehydrogenase subunit 1